MGWQEQGDGKWSYGLNIENGRLYDNDELQLKAALRAVCHEFKTEIRMTGHQSVIFTDIDEGDKEKLIGLIKQHNVPTTEETSTVRRWSMSCVALPTCGSGDHRERAAFAGHHRWSGAATGKTRVGQGTIHDSHDGMPQRMCPTLQRRHRRWSAKRRIKYTLFAGGGWLGNRLGLHLQGYGSR